MEDLITILSRRRWYTVQLHQGPLSQSRTVYAHSEQEARRMVGAHVRKLGLTGLIRVGPAKPAKVPR